MEFLPEPSSNKLCGRTSKYGKSNAYALEDLKLGDGNPIKEVLLKLNLHDHSIIPAESDSLPHAHAQTTKIYYKHQDSRINKAQELKTKTSANSDIKDPSSETKLQGVLLESFPEDAKYEHVGQDTRSQDGKDVKDNKGERFKDLGTKDKFCHFLVTLQNLNPIDDEPMWAADYVVGLTSGSAITILETVNEFAIKANFDRSAGQANPKGSSSKPYQPPQARNKHVNDVFTRSGKTYAPPINLNDQPNDFETPINFDSDDEDDEPTPQPKPKEPKPVKETPIPKPYKPKILYRQRLRKEKMEAQYGKFLDMIQAVRINVPLVNVLAGMPNYGKFLKELVSNKHKIEQISAAFLSDESSAILQNKVPPKLGDPRNFIIPCNFNKAFSCNALADLGASINLMPYSLYAKLSLKTLKPTKMSIRLADRSFQYPIGIAKNMLVEVGKFTFPVNFVILEMEEDSKVPLIFERPFLHTTDAVIRVKQKKLNLGVRTERMIFNIDSAMKHSYSNDDTCFSIDVIDEILEEYFDALLDEGSKILHSIEGTILEEKLFAEFDEFMAMTTDENSESESDTEEPPFENSPLTPIIRSKRLLKNLL
ncbi:reverse transcriptase domain-containing protein [Tanacetum coccineum]|uniref:Reverse transcriptase domain-containing protein n=1 Tax=Tanacetum coccineum TaxID=301880 RepID=A0ABQ4Y1A6_9ASTR